MTGIWIYKPMDIKNKIKVCHVLAKLEIGGMENGIVNLCNFIDREEFVPIVCCLRGLGSMVQRMKSDVKVIDLKFSEGKDYLGPFKVARLFRIEKPDIVHAHAWGGGSLYGIIGARIAGVTVVINGEHGSLFLKSYQIFLQRMLSTLCNITLSVSESLKCKINKRLGVSKKRIKCIPNGVDTVLFNGEHDTTALKRELYNKFGIEISNDNFLIGSVGSLKPEKNQKMLLEAISYLNKKNPLNNIKVLIIGDGRDRGMLEDKAKKICFKGQIIFLGQRDDLPQLYSLIDLLVSTSISEHEGMSNVVLEAMSSGVPVISTKSIGAGELIVNGINGFLVPPNDFNSLAKIIEKIMKDIKIRDEIVSNAKEKVIQNYSMVKMVSVYENVYRELLYKS